MCSQTLIASVYAWQKSRAQHGFCWQGFVEAERARLASENAVLEAQASSSTLPITVTTSVVSLEAIVCLHCG
jgi:hypothetical protein